MPARRKSKTKEAKKISHILRPPDLSLEEWQIRLRQQITFDEPLRLKNLGIQSVFSTFQVTNPETKKKYRVVIAGETLGINYCSCVDFSVNTLGTCKHIEFVLRRLRRRKVNRQIFKDGFHPEISAVTLRYGLKRRAAFLLGKTAGPDLKSLVQEFFDSEGFLTEKGFYHFEEFVRRTKELSCPIEFHEDALEFVAQVRDVKIRQERIKQFFPEGIQGKEWDSLLKVELYPYQKEGALFAASSGRCLLADDMGLGKTIQAIAASEIMARSLGVEKVLIICPASLKYQWKEEIKRFTDRSVQILEGRSHQRDQQYQAQSFFKIINYDVIHQDTKRIAQLNPDLIILDEAQRIKNWKTRIARVVKQLKSPYAFILTGTPLENRLEELHSIVEFIDHHHLGPLFRFLHRHQVIDDKGKVTGYKDLNSIGDSLKNILIRRNRTEVLKQLPPRADKNHFVALTPEQREIHQENRDVVARLVAKWRRFHFLSEQDQKRLMMALQNMRMVCDDVYLVDERKRGGHKVKELEVQLKEIFEQPEAKVVLFSQWIRMMELVQEMLKQNRWNHVFLHGGVPSSKRGDLIRHFREDPSCRLFLSTEAGGVGLNLQNAAFVVNMDLPWNPAVLEQRIGRVHRLGQKQPVRVINFIAESSIEHGMLGVLQFKRSMFKGVLDQGENEIFMGSSRFNQFIKTVEEATQTVDAQKSSSAEAPQPQEAQATPALETPQKEEIPENRLTKFLELGAAFLGNLSQSLKSQDSTFQKSSSRLPNQPPLGIRFRQEETSGRKIMEIPLPEEKTLDMLTQILEDFLNVLKKT